jgi:hypothetical protein
VDELYILARRVLLDALAALGPHRDALVLVGAQAVYLHVGEADLAVAPYTTDGDLVINPELLAAIPPLEENLRNAGFRPKGSESIGVWVATLAGGRPTAAEMTIDLLVPLAVNPGKGRRAARLQGHDHRAARATRGLEGALVDLAPMTITALDPTDVRLFELNVAGTAALLTAKLHKIQDRAGSKRAQDKDALDILRILRGTTTEALAERFRLLLSDARSAEVARMALALLRAQFLERPRIGIAMTLSAVGALADHAEIEASGEALAGDLLRALQS